jgi:bifunctional non-homologous end joining protein LigD
MISHIINKDVELVTRNLNSYTSKYPQIAKDLLKFKKNIVVDGEIVVLDSGGNPSFQLMQNYLRTMKGTIVYYIFDVLWYNGYNTEKLPLTERKNLLQEIIPKSNLIFYSDHIEREGKKLFDAAKEKGIEGIVAKQAKSLYYEGIRTRNWLKIKTETRQEAIICGFTEPRGSRLYFGSLILGLYENKELKYIGHTGTGFDYSKLKDMHKLLVKYKQDKSPFKKPPKTNSPVTWLKPVLVCEVKFSNWTDVGIMRHPVFVGLREDKSPTEVVREKIDG